MRFALCMMLVVSAACGCAGDGRARAQAGPGAGPAGASGQGGSTEPLCDLASPEEVGSTLSIAGLLAPVITTNVPVTLCEYRRRDAIEEVAVRVRYELGATAGEFDIVRSSYENRGMPTKDEAIGDEAFSTTQPLTFGEISTLVVMQGDTQLLISAFAPVDAEIDLANKILPRL